ncbi:MAG: NAD(P)H-dependent D-xylose reductase (XR), partial [Chaenotheca gracillima]
MSGPDKMDQYSESSETSPPTTGESASQVCLCPPDPKIPRPRNAFMLYRQHLQSSVVAQNPGLANPEISKIIGKTWREESQEVKRYWDSLAEEEKTRHHQQYPNYKYQPRRKGKTAANMPCAESSRTSEGWCIKCGRRSISTPRTPITPFTSGMSTPRLPPPTPSSPSTTLRRYSMDVPRYLPPVNASGPGTPGVRRGFNGPPGTYSNGPMSHIRESIGEEDEVSPLTPSAKRLRISGSGASSTNGKYPSPPLPMRGAPTFRRDSMPYPALQTGRMGPPPRPSHAPPLSNDMSLTLPPLQTTQSRSVEAMVMTIPIFNKIKVLSKISPALQTPGPTSPRFAVRGALVAVDGVDPDAVSQVVRWLDQELTRNGDGNVVAVVDGADDVVDEPMKDVSDSRAGTYGPPSPNSREMSRDASRSDFNFEEYLSIVTGWHQRSTKLIKYITTPPPAARSLTPASPYPNSPSSDTPNRQSQQQLQQQISHISPPTRSSSSSPTPAAPAPTPSHGTPTALSSGPSLTPIALVPNYMLTNSNLAACRIPINDAYAPLDHWQWAATLWRGIVGPDLTIWIQDCTKEEMARQGASGGVEIREDAAAIVVRREKGQREIE